MEDLLVRVYSCIDQMGLGLQGVGRKVRARLPKSIKLVHLRKRKSSHYKSLLLELKTEWVKVINEVFQTINNSEIIGEIAEYMVRTIYNVSLKYDIDFDDGLALSKVIVLPIISEIMDESELNMKSNQRQDMRKHFLYQLTTVVPIVQIIEYQTQNEDIQVSMSIDHDFQTQDLTAQSDTSVPLENMQPEPQAGLPDYTIWVSEQALDLLFGAICKHSEKVSEREANDHYIRHIFHIMNITHIVDILNRYIDTMKTRKLQPLDSRVELRDEAINKYQEYISSSLELFDIDHPLSIFRNDLRQLSSNIRVLKNQNLS